MLKTKLIQNQWYSLNIEIQKIEIISYNEQLL